MEARAASRLDLHHNRLRSQKSAMWRQRLFSGNISKRPARIGLSFPDKIAASLRWQPLRAQEYSMGQAFHADHTRPSQPNPITTHHRLALRSLDRPGAKKRRRPKSIVGQFRSSRRPKSTAGQFRSSRRPKSNVGQFRSSRRPKSIVGQFRSSRRPKSIVGQFKNSQRSKSIAGQFRSSRRPKSIVDQFKNQEETKRHRRFLSSHRPRKPRDHPPQQA